MLEAPQGSNHPIWIGDQVPTQDTSAPLHKTCSKCAEWKPIDDFPLTRGKRFNCCRKCQSLNAKRWADANREKVRIAKKAYEKRYPDRVAESKSKNFAIHGERYKKATSEAKQANREEENRKLREQYRRDPTPFQLRNKRREDREAALPGTFTKDDRITLLNQQNWECNGCLRPIDERAHADHRTPVVRGGSNGIENRQMLCKRCNHLKGTMTQEEWMMRRAG